MRIGAALSLLAAAVMVATAHAARAQQGARESQLGSLIARPKPADIPETARMSDTDRARTTMYEYADCVVLSQSRSAANYFAIKRDDPASNKTLVRLAGNDCMRDGELKMPPLLLRGALFRSAYLHRFKMLPSSFAPMQVRFDSQLNAPQNPSNAGYLVMMEFADCVARKDPANVDRLVRSLAGTPDEATALRAVAPNFGPCMIAGAKVTLNRAVIGAVLSEALYREAVAAQADTAAGQH